MKWIDRFLVLLICAIIYFFNFFWKISLVSSSGSRDASSIDKSQRCVQKTKLILFGSKWGSEKHYYFLPETVKMCPHCIFTEDMKLFNLSDAVVFNARTLEKRPPNYRPNNQIWVFLLLESYGNKGSTLRRVKNYRNMFNWTMTYRRDSDIFMPYGRIISNDEIKKPDLGELWAYFPGTVPRENGLYDVSATDIPSVDDLKGRRMAAWIVSHCETPSKREEIAKQLGKYIQLDIYGRCGHLSCEVPRSKAKTGAECGFHDARKYKFYLSFENSLCEDYVTEKFFDTLLTQMIPIVYGAANYSDIAPANSFINVADFDSVGDLAEYILHLDRHPKEYLKYFEWKKEYWVQNNGFVTGYCDLCNKLWAHDFNSNGTKIYVDTLEWWAKRSDHANSFLHSCYPPKI